MEIEQEAIKGRQKSNQLQTRFMSMGSQSLSDAELLAIILRTGNSRCSAVDLAQQILATSDNNLAELTKRSAVDLMKIKGIGSSKAAAIMATFEIGRRRRFELPAKRNQFPDSRHAAGFIRPLIEDYPNEVFGVIYLTRSGSLIKWELLSQGGITGTVVDPRIMFKKAFEYGAASIIVSHNHPSGNSRPSKEDEFLTKKLKDACTLMDIKLRDHIIIAVNTYFSFADEGLLYNSSYSNN